MDFISSLPRIIGHNTTHPQFVQNDMRFIMIALCSSGCTRADEFSESQSLLALLYLALHTNLHVVFSLFRGHAINFLLASKA